jgi:tetratricopeptide (TPR) repeat protein
VMVYLKLRRKYFRELEQQELLDLEGSIMDAMCGRSASISDSAALKKLLKDRLRVEKEKRDADLFFERGHAKSMQGEGEFQKGREAAALPLFQEAEKFFTQAIDRDADFPEACCQRAIARWRQRKYPEAIADCDLAAKKDPDLWTSYWIRSKIRRESGDREGAEADWKRYTDLVQKDKFLKEMLSTRPSD